MHFLVISRYLQIWFPVNFFGVDQVLTKLLQIDQKLTFNIFDILNQYRISKIEKNIGWYRPPPKKMTWGGGVWSLRVQGFGVCLGPHIMISKFTRSNHRRNRSYSKGVDVRQSINVFRALCHLFCLCSSQNSSTMDVRIFSNLNVKPFHCGHYCWWLFCWSSASSIICLLYSLFCFESKGIRKLFKNL